MTEPAICVQPFVKSYAGLDDLGRQVCGKPALWRNKNRKDPLPTLCDCHYRAIVESQGNTRPPEESLTDWEPMSTPGG